MSSTRGRVAWMPPYIQPNYWEFYFDGRESKLLRRDSVDIDAVVAEILADKTPHEAITAACERAADELLTNRKKRAWLEENADAIHKAGGDSEEAYRAWARGRVDELASVLEADVLDAVAEDACPDDDSEGLRLGLRRWRRAALVSF